jgi:hypothetical protein
MESVESATQQQQARILYGAEIRPTDLVVVWTDGRDAWRGTSSGRLKAI